jgi:hypothetical protein
LIDIGYALWSVSDSASTELGQVKGMVRAVARKDGASSVQFEGSTNARCQVTIQPPAATFSHTSTAELALILGNDFGSLFDTVVTHKPRSDFAERMLALPVDQQQAILQRMRMTDPTPRVSFKRA